MNLDWKKIGLIALFILAVCLFAFFIYYFFFAPFITTEEPVTTDETPITDNGLPITANINGQIFPVDSEGRLPIGIDINGEPIYEPADSRLDEELISDTILLTANTTRYVTNGSSNKLIYYDPEKNRFYTIDADGNISIFNNKEFYDVENVTWSHDTNKAILEYPDGSQIIYDFKKNEQITIPQHWKDFGFSSSDQDIIFKSMGIDPDNRFLVVAKNDGSQAKSLEAIGEKENQFDVNWSPNNQMVATFEEGANLNQTNVYFIGLNNENFKLMKVEGRDFRGQWSPEGDKMLYSVYDPTNGYRPQLWIADAGANTIGNNRQKIDLETWSNKCTFSSNDLVFCAVPEKLSYGVGLQPSEANNVPDRIYEINLKTGSKKLIAIPDGVYTVDKIILTNNKNYLFFTDKNNGQIYKIDIQY